MKRLIIVGSPRTNGRSAHLAEMLFEANIDEHPEDELFLVPVSEVEIGPCVGCNACRKKSGVIVKDDEGNEVTLQKHRCVFDDDMQTLYDLIDEADEVSVVSPIYFSGAPSQMKCVLDRLQPYFWERIDVRASGEPLPEKRPLTLHVLGEGGDPHGYDALVSEVKSAFATADFRLERVLDWVGKIDEAGEITAEADEIELGSTGSWPAGAGALQQAAGESEEGSQQVRASLGGGRAQQGGAGTRQGQSGQSGQSGQRGGKPRPKLNLHAGISDAEPGAKSKAESSRKQSGGKQSGGKQAAGRQSGGKQGGKSNRPSGASSSSKKPRRTSSGGSAASSKKQSKRRGN